LRPWLHLPRRGSLCTQESSIRKDENRPESLLQGVSDLSEPCLRKEWMCTGPWNWYRRVKRPNSQCLVQFARWFLCERKTVVVVREKLCVPYLISWADKFKRTGLAV
jgi:hypothetical protein